MVSGFLTSIIAVGMFSTRLHFAFPASMGGNPHIVTNITTLETKDIIISHLLTFVSGEQMGTSFTRGNNLLRTTHTNRGCQLTILLVGRPAWGKWSCCYTNFYQRVSMEGLCGHSAMTLWMLVPSQRHCDSKHADNTVHGAILPPHCAASWEGGQKKITLQSAWHEDTRQ